MWMKPSTILAWVSTRLRVLGHRPSCSCKAGQHDSCLCVSDAGFVRTAGGEGTTTVGRIG